MLGNNQDPTKKKFSHRQKQHGMKTKKRSKKVPQIDTLKDDRFADFNKPEKKPPVDMYGKLTISQEEFSNYISSSDDEPEMLIPEDALPSKNDNDVYSDQISSRMALINQPWKQITAQDIFQYFYLNMDDKDDLLSVRVVLSRYGQEHPETEAPPPTDNEEIETALWRSREESDFKRYFAICEFKDAQSADFLYKKMSGVEISDEKGGFFDLQFMGDEEYEIVKSFPVRDEATNKIDDWDPPEVYCKFLTNTKNTDTWDSAPADRVAAHEKIWSIEGDDFENEADDACKILIGTGSEDEERPTREGLEEMIREANKEEEEEITETESDENGFDVKFVEEKKENDLQSENKDKKKKHKKKSTDEIGVPQNEKNEETVKDLMDDDRFKEFYARPGYGFNTADSSFKRTDIMEKFMDEVSKKHMEANRDSHKDKTQEEHESDLLKSTAERLKQRAAKRINSNKK